MRKHYDFSNSKPNPYAAKPKKQITIRLDEDTISYFKSLSDTKGIPYQSLINLYLRDCAAQAKATCLFISAFGTTPMPPTKLLLHHLKPR